MFARSERARAGASSDLFHLSQYSCVRSSIAWASNSLSEFVDSNLRWAQEVRMSFHKALQQSGKQRASER